MTVWKKNFIVIFYYGQNLNFHVNTQKNMTPNKKFIEETLKQLVSFDNINDDLVEFFKNIIESIHSLRELKKKITNDFTHTRMFFTRQKELYNKEIRLLESKVLDMNRELREFVE